MAIRVKRVYDDREDDDGARVLVDRLWPRGISKEDAALDEWMREVAPSDELREWFDHDPDKWDEFEERYRAELTERDELVEELTTLADSGTLTLLYGASDREHNNALVLKSFLKERMDDAT